VREVLLHPDAVLEEPVGEEVVVYVADPESLHLLDGPAHLVWRLAQDRTLDSLVAALSEQFPGQPDLPAEVAAAVDLLLAKGLLVTGRADHHVDPAPDGPE
jgi:hypothetical protein